MDTKMLDVLKEVVWWDFEQIKEYTSETVIHTLIQCPIPKSTSNCSVAVAEKNFESSVPPPVHMYHVTLAMHIVLESDNYIHSFN